MGLTFPQNKTGSFASTTSVAVSLNANPVAGHVVLVVLSLNSTATSITVSGFGASSWTSAITGAGTAISVQSSVGLNVSGASSSGTVTLPATASGSWVAIEIEGASNQLTLGGSWPVKVTGSGSGGTGTTITAGSVIDNGYFAGIIDCAAWLPTSATVTSEALGWQSLATAASTVGLAVSAQVGPLDSLPNRADVWTLSGSSTDSAWAGTAIPDAASTLVLYFHNATSTVAGTLPGSTSESANSPTVTATGASTNRVMNGTVGASQTSQAGSTSGVGTAQSMWFRRFISPPLCGCTFSSLVSAPALHVAGSESNAASNFQFDYLLEVWRPSTGARVGRLMDTGSPDTQEVTTSETAIVASSWAAMAQLTILDGDVLVCEIWRGNIAQATSVSRTNTFFYDGTTVDSASSNAGLLDFGNNPTPLVFYPAMPDPPGHPESVGRLNVVVQATNRAASI